MKRALFRGVFALLLSSTSAGVAQTEITDEQFERLAAIAVPPQLSEREPGVHTVPCLPHTPAEQLGNVEGEGFYCGGFTVPIDWENPERGYLDLGFMVARAHADNLRPHPILYIAGGSGTSAVLSDTQLKVV